MGLFGNNFASGHLGFRYNWWYYSKVEADNLVVLILVLFFVGSNLTIPVIGSISSSSYSYCYIFPLLFLAIIMTIIQYFYQYQIQLYLIFYKHRHVWLIHVYCEFVRGNIFCHILSTYMLSSCIIFLQSKFN